MRKIYVIGTSHQCLSPEYEKELERLFLLVNPDQILVEKEQIELSSNKFKPGRPEMQFAYEWAIHKGIHVDAFDHRHDVVRKTISKKELAKANMALERLTEKYGWKKLNRPEYLGELESLLDTIVDRKKHQQREKRMLVTVNKKMLKEGRVLILTGSYHLPLFRRNFPDALLITDIE